MRNFPKSRLIKTHPWRIDSSWMSSDQRRVVISTRWRTADRLNINMSSYQYGVYRHTDKAVVRPFFFFIMMGIHAPGNTVFILKRGSVSHVPRHPLVEPTCTRCDLKHLKPPMTSTFADHDPLSSGGWFNINMPSYQYRKSRCGDKTTLRPSYLHNGISYTGKMASLHWIRALVSNAPSYGWQSCCTVDAQFWLVQP